MSSGLRIAVLVVGMGVLLSAPGGADEIGPSASPARPVVLGLLEPSVSGPTVCRPSRSSATNDETPRGHGAWR
jgi:hypothetical protein